LLRWAYLQRQSNRLTGRKAVEPLICCSKQSWKVT
jgi:hypothetical protein